MKFIQKKNSSSSKSWSWDLVSCWSWDLSVPRSYSWTVDLIQYRTQAWSYLLRFRVRL